MPRVFYIIITQHDPPNWMSTYMYLQKQKKSTDLIHNEGVSFFSMDFKIQTTFRLWWVGVVNDNSWDGVDISTLYLHHV